MTKWYEKNGNDSDVVVSSRIRLARNTTEFPFSTKISEDEGNELIDKVFNRLEDSDYSEIMKYNRLNLIGENQKYSLLEQQAINKYMAARKNGAVAVSNDGSISVMVNSEDHIRIQAMISGMDLTACYKAADICDDFLEEFFDYAYSEKYGYHTTYPTNIGTGLRAAYRLHLPALGNTKKLQLLAGELGRFGIRMSACYGEGMNGMGDLYEISNQHTLGQSELDIIHNLNSVAVQLVEQERELRNAFVERSRVKAEDEAYKSYGVLKYSRCLSIKNAMVLLSEIRMGMCLGTIEFSNMDNFSVYGMMLAIQPRTLQYNCNREKAMSVEEIDVARAKYIRERLPEIK